MALESKGFGASKKRTYYLRLSMTRNDAMVLAILALLLAAAIALRVAGYGGVEGFSR